MMEINMSKNQQEMYTLILRGATFCVVAFLWYLSVIWSADGFSINDPELRWIGIGLALSVTISQLVFNRGSANPTIFLVGLAAYAYGFATNFIGISKVIGTEFTMENLNANPFGFIISGLGVLALSLIVEAAPESFLLWALYPREQSPGDFISSLFKGANLPNRKRSGVPRSVPTNVRNIPERSKQPVLSYEQPVFIWIDKYRRENGDRMPSYDKIVQNTPLSSKSMVKPYIKKYKERNRSHN
jgi:hypothetical protein